MSKMSVGNGGGGGDMRIGLKRRSRRWAVVFCLLAFAVPVATGALIAGGRIPDLVNAVVNFFVTDPVKTANIDRGYSVDQTSQLNVYDTDATNGYVVRARLDAGVSPELTVRIWSAGSNACSANNPCQLFTDRDIVVGGSQTNSATLGSGDVIDFGLRIHSTVDLPIGPHDVKVIYTKERVYTMQSFTGAACAALPIYPTGGEVEVFLTDARDGKTYTVRRLADNRCWMVDNLALKPDVGNPMTLNSINSDLTLAYTLKAEDVYDPNNTTYCSSLDAAVYPQKCGMRYSYTAAVGSTNGSGSSAGSICPKGWRLPRQEAGPADPLTTLGIALGWTASPQSAINSPWRGLLAGNTTMGEGSIGAYFTGGVTGANASPLVLMLGPNSITYNDAVNNLAVKASVRCWIR